MLKLKMQKTLFLEERKQIKNMEIAKENVQGDSIVEDSLFNI